MDNLQLYVLELTKEDVEDLIQALDQVVRSQGLNVSERCSQLHRLLLSVTPKPLHDPQQMHTPQPVVQPEPVVQPQPVPYPEYVPTPEEIEEHENFAKEKLEKELSELIEEKPKSKKSKSKTTSKKKTAKKK